MGDGAEAHTDPAEGVWGLGCSPGTTVRTAGRGVWERGGQAGPGRPGTQAECARQGEEAGSRPYTCSSGTRPADLPCPAPPQPPPEPTGSGRSWVPCQRALLRWGSNRPLWGHQDEEGSRSVKGEDSRPGLWNLTVSKGHWPRVPQGWANLWAPPARPLWFPPDEMVTPLASPHQNIQAMTWDTRGFKQERSPGLTPVTQAPGRTLP